MNSGILRLNETNPFSFTHKVGCGMSKYGNGELNVMGGELPSSTRGNSSSPFSVPNGKKSSNETSECTSCISKKNVNILSILNFKNDGVHHF